ISDNHGRLCFALALWNGRDPILKERLFGLTGSEGNHGEDVKEYYFYLDSTPTHSYMKYLYKYPQAAFPYGDLVDTNRQRDRPAPCTAAPPRSKPITAALARAGSIATAAPISCSRRTRRTASACGVWRTPART